MSGLGDYDDYLAAATSAIRAGNPDVLGSLGFTELVEAVNDPEARRAVCSFFEAEGRELALGSGALLRVALAPYAQLLGNGELSTARVAIAVPGINGEWGPAPSTTAIAAPGAAVLYADQIGVGFVSVSGRRADVDGAPLAPDVERWLVAEDGATPLLSADDPALGAARSRSVALVRLALAASLVGTSQAALDAAVIYANDRRQFGAPISGFQAVRHLLAHAAAELAAARDTYGAVLELPPDIEGWSEMCAIAKAIGGRSALRVTQLAMQVLGAIGFTEEHEHTARTNRVLVLDALYGSCSELARAIGRGGVPLLPVGKVLVAASAERT